MLDPQRLPEIQQAIADAGADAWLFMCFQHNDPVSLDLLGLAGKHFVSLAVGDVAVVPLSRWRHFVPRYLDKT